MKKISVRERFILCALALCLGSYLGYTCLWQPARAELSVLSEQERALKATIGDQTPLDAKLSELELQNRELQNSIEAHKALQGKKTLNKEDFLVYLGRQCNENKVNLIQFSDLGTQEENNVWQVQMHFELRGTLPRLNRICESIQSIGIRYSVGGLTLRQDKESEYLRRYFDSVSKLEWYQYEPPEEKEEEEETRKEATHDPTATPEPAVPFQIPQFTAPPAVSAPPTALPTATATPMSSPEPTIEPTYEPEEKAADQPDQLLEQTSVGNRAYWVMPLSNTAKPADFSNDVMRLDITIQFTVYHDPQDDSNSFLNQQEGGNGIL